MNEMVKIERKNEIVVYQPNETMRFVQLGSVPVKLRGCHAVQPTSTDEYRLEISFWSEVYFTF